MIENGFKGTSLKAGHSVGGWGSDVREKQRRPEVRGNEREWSLRVSENQERVVYKKPRKMKPKEIKYYRDQ